jgi:hypothetical protein
LALDEPKDSDEVKDVRGFTFIMDKELYGQAKPVKVDLSYMGFNVTSNLVLGGGGCGSSCSSGSCGS